jgi:lipopolysaccharide/colanic/teichoic acid biosynthesis glycosyltransferase
MNSTTALLTYLKEPVRSEIMKGKPVHTFFKRLFDIALALIGILILSPLLLIVYVLLKMESSEAPAIYISKRVGSNYKVFDLYKFRSMVADADTKINEMDHLNLYKKEATPEKIKETSDVSEEISSVSGESKTLLFHDDEMIEEAEYLRRRMNQNGTAFKKFNADPRITKVGSFIRNTSIDELPQLFNILKGDMSLVGNRPLPLYEAERLTTDQGSKRFLASAGLTGLWQVSKRGKAEMTEQERIDLDVEYAENESLWLDLKIILKTFPALFQKENV